MLSYFLGTDDFSKKAYIKQASGQQGQDLEFFYAEDQAPEALHLAEQNLFSKSKTFILEGISSKLKFTDEEWERIIGNRNSIIIIEESIDRRISQNKRLLSHKKAAVKEFNLPHGKELNNWIINKAKELNVKISPKAIEALAVFLGRDEAVETKAGGKVIKVEEIYSLWQADSELKKLIAFAQGRQIEEET